MGIFDKFRKDKDEKGIGEEVGSTDDAIARLSDASDEEKVELAMNLLKNPNYMVRVSAASEVARLGIRAVGVWFELANMLADGHEEARTGSAKAFWELKGVDYAIRSLRDEYENPAHISKEDALVGITALRETADDETAFEKLLKENWENYPMKKTGKTCPICGAPAEELKGSSVSSYINTYSCTKCDWAKPRCGNTSCDGMMDWTPTSYPTTFEYTCQECGWHGMGPLFVVKKR